MRILLSILEHDVELVTDFDEDLWNWTIEAVKVRLDGNVFFRQENAFMFPDWIVNL